MDVPSFITGAGLASMAWAVIYWASVGAMRREDAAFRRKQRERIDALAAVSEQRYEQARKDIGLPPRLKS